MFIEQSAHPAECQQEQPHQQPGQHAHKIQPDVQHLTAPPRGEELDGLIRQGREQASQNGPGHVPDKMPGVHPQAEHEQEALQGILAEMCQLADKMHGDVGCKAGHPQPGEHPLYQAKHPAAGPLRHHADLHGVGEDERDAADERQRKDHPPGDEPGRSARVLF